MRAIAGDAVPVRPAPQRPLALTPRLQNRPSRRLASTATAETAKDIDDPLIEGANLPVTDTTPSGQQRKGIAVQNRKALEKELVWLKDPFKLTEHIHFTLRNNDPDKALDLCRIASKSMDCVVSWNAIVDWYMQRFKVNDAVKVYNEMKKRAQFPDSYTYVLLLRGLSRRSHVGLPVKEENVSKAVSIYHSMNSPSSRVKPAIIHTNAALKVCADALDLDAMWGIAGQLPERGPGAPDKLTYTIILTAIRFGAYGQNPEGLPLEQIAIRRQKAVNEGKRVWLDVIRKWRAGEIQIDEDLVAAMGRLLLTSKSMHDWDNALDLVKQTMKIDRLIPSIGDPGRKTDHVPQDPEELAQAKVQEQEADEEGYVDSPALNAFKSTNTIASVPDPDKPLTDRSNLIWVEPGNKTLSMLTDACLQMRIPRTASAYWELLTNSPYLIRPDIPNFDAQLRLLSTNRSSTRIARLFKEDLANAGLAPKNSTLRIAMKGCQRDMKNSHALENATAIIDAMEASCPDPDVQTLNEYLSLAITTNDGGKIIAAINRLEPIVHHLRSRITYGPDRMPANPEADTREMKAALTFLQTLVGTIDTLLHRSLVPEGSYQMWHARRGDLTHFIGRSQERIWRRQDREADLDEGEAKKRYLASKKEYLEKRNGKYKVQMTKAQWQLRKMKWNSEESRGRRRQKRVGEREVRFNPRSVGGGEVLGEEGGGLREETQGRVGFGVD